MPRRTTPSPGAAKVGARIRDLRIERGLSLQQVAEAGQISKGHLSSIEHGLAAITIETLERIARGLDLLPMDLWYPSCDPHHSAFAFGRASLWP